MPDQNNTAAAGGTAASAGKPAGITGADKSAGKPAGITGAETVSRNTASRNAETTGAETANKNKSRRSVISQTKKTPENMNDYIRVTNPGVWILIVAMLSLVIGALCWGIFGHVDRTLDATVYVKNGHTICYVSENYVSEIEEGMTVRYSNTEGTIREIGPADDGTNTCTIKAKRISADGYYNGTIVLEKISPVSFLLD